MPPPAPASPGSKRRTIRRSPWRRLLTALVVIPALTALTLGASLWWAERPLKAVERALAQRDFRRAIELSDEYLRGDPYSSRALDLKAQAHVGAGKYRDALAIYDRLGSDTLTGQRAWAEALLHEQRWTDALPLLRQVDQKKPHDPDIVHELAACASQSGEFDMAVGKAEELRSLPGQADRGEVLLGVLHSNHGNYRLAAQALESLLNRNPQAHGLQVSPAEIFQGLGQAYLNDGRPDDAVLRLDQAVALQPTAERYSLLGDACELTGETERAEEAWRKSIELAPQLRRAREGLARLALERRQPDQAREWLLPLAESPGVTSSIAHLMCRACTLLGNSDEAARFEALEASLRKAEDHKLALDDLVKQSPQSFWALAVRAHKFATEGNLVQAAALLQVVDGIRQKNPEASSDPQQFVDQLIQAVFEREPLPSLELVPVESH